MKFFHAVVIRVWQKDFNLNALTLQTDRVHRVRYVLVVIPADEYAVSTVPGKPRRRRLSRTRAHGTSRPRRRRDHACRRYQRPHQHRLKFYR